MFLPFLKNPFASKNLAREDFRDLMAGTLTRMAGQNAAGLYTAQIAALQPHHDAYATFLGTQDVNLGQRMGSTDVVNQLLADFRRFAKEELLVDVAYVFGRKTPDAVALAAFLPQGRSEYNGVTLLTLPTLLERAATLTATYKDALGKDLADKAASFKKNYDTDRELQGQSKGAVQGDSKAEKKLRKAAARQLKLNLLEQVKQHIDTPDDVKALYDPKIFTQPTKPAPGAAPTAP
ncbi:hypothetical protein [Hymenobacter negativus]|uniref:Uncharacterized protein n=1 Tax=Hymenobacter negativus TaxID=2795026 RepID=A0ABS3QAD1_9BACT|nr:hypothetical protein [Hymenobacter negativus]MBO2008107.1 hypothetical protein [Hymenobacter negativus]